MALTAFRDEPDEAEMAALARDLELISDPDIRVSYKDVQASATVRGGTLGGRRRRSGRTRPS
jgi:hypothetical protein